MSKSTSPQTTLQNATQDFTRELQHNAENKTISERLGSLNSNRKYNSLEQRVKLVDLSGNDTDQTGPQGVARMLLPCASPASCQFLHNTPSWLYLHQPRRYQL